MVNPNTGVDEQWLQRVELLDDTPLGRSIVVDHIRTHRLGDLDELVANFLDGCRTAFGEVWDSDDEVPEPLVRHFSECFLAIHESGMELPAWLQPLLKEVVEELAEDHDVLKPPEPDRRGEQ